jgi:DNA polymerase (family 10)
MTGLQNEDIARLLREYGQRSALLGGNPYRARAYRTAADSLATLSEPLADIIEAGELTAIPGIGDAIANIITKLHKTGSHPKLEELRKEFPETLLALLDIPGLRTEQVLKLYKETGISDIETLEKSLRADKIKDVKFLTPALKRKILQGIEIRQQSQDKKHIHRAAALAEQAEKNLKTNRPDLKNIIVAGELRRQCELVGDLVFVALGPKNQKLKNGALTIWLCTEDKFGSTLLFATGSDAHLGELKKRARAKKLFLSSQGLKRGKKVIASRTEEEIYKTLDIPYIEPELREGRDEIEKVTKGRITSLVKMRDINGILHAHTEKSDGLNTLEEMAEAVRARGYQYFGVSDHSQSAYYAGGLKKDEISTQHKEVARLNKKYGDKFQIFKGIESDILVDGSLDYPESLLKKFDFIVASIHGQFRLDAGQQTARIIKAIENPYTTILGHMTGRQLLRRHGYDVDIEEILKACAAHGVAVEINANPWRLDVDWRWHQTAMEAGCVMSINPDAHSTSEIDNMKWGVAMARKGGIPPERVLNCMTLKQFKEFLASRKKKALH